MTTFLASALIISYCRWLQLNKFRATASNYGEDLFATYAKKSTALGPGFNWVWFESASWPGNWVCVGLLLVLDSLAASIWTKTMRGCSARLAKSTQSDDNFNIGNMIDH